MAEPLEVLLGRLLSNRGLQLAVAESCTGGLVSHLVTNVSGSSEYFRGGITAYANEAKIRLLGVRPDTIEKFGAVSEETVLEMARGVRQALASDLGLSVSGIAGPGGGTAGKPVGTTWVGFSGPDGEVSKHFLFSGDRLEVKGQAAQKALELVISYLDTDSTDGSPEKRAN
jgi:PncC family amidohydrolase